MTEKSRPEALVAKNASDFDQLTEAIKDALKKIEGDRRLKPTQEVLAKLAGCTRGTLNNRGWPLTELDAVKQARKKKRESAQTERADVKAGASESDSEVETLRRQLQFSRTENSRLHDKNVELATELKQAKDLLAEVTRLTKNTRHDVTPSQPKRSPAQVVSLRERAVAKSDAVPSKQ